MNSNYYNNMYGYPYYQQQPSYYGNQYGNQYQNVMPQQAQVQQAQQVAQTNYLPLTFVNGIEGAKAFIVPANSTVFLKDSDSNVLFEKKADAQGKYTLIAYTLTQIKDINNIGKELPQETQVNTISKEDLRGFVTIDDFKRFESNFLGEIDKLSNLIEKTPRKQENYQKRGN